MNVRDDSENKLRTEAFVRELCRMADRLDSGEPISIEEMQPLIARMEGMTAAVLDLALESGNPLPAQFAKARQRLRCYLKDQRGEDYPHPQNRPPFEFQPLGDLAANEDELRKQQYDLASHARAYLERGETRVAAKHVFQALDIFDQRRRLIRDEQQQIFFAKEEQPLITSFLEEFLRQEDWDSALQIVERSKARAFSSVLGLTEIRRPSDGSELALHEEALLEKVRTLTADAWNGKEDEWGGFRRWNQLVELGSELEGLWTTMSEDAAWAEYVSMRKGTSPNIQDMRSCLHSTPSAPPTSALLSYYVDQKTTWLFVLPPNGLAPFARDTGVTPDHLRACAQRLLIDCHGYSAEHKRQIELYEQALELRPAIRTTSRPEGLAPDRRKLADPNSNYALTYLDELSDRLLPRSIRPVLKDCEVLCISPHGPLHSLPLHALRWNDGAYLGGHFGVCYVSSFAVLRYCQGRNRRRRATAAYRPTTGLLACVDMLGEQTKEFEADQDLLAPLSNTGATDEVCRVLTGATGVRSATKQRVIQESASSQVIHLSCHGIFASDCEWKHPLQSGVLLSDGRRTRIESERLRTHPEEFQDCLLTAREIYNLRLKADLVTLGACSTGRAHVEAGDDLMGLSRAWLYAGTPALLVSLWNVDTMSSHRFLQDFYQQWLEAGEPKWRALQLAQKSLINDSDNPEYRHPYHWAPFVLIGDWI
jgi:CHAT domain-containing protein